MSPTRVDYGWTVCPCGCARRFHKRRRNQIYLDKAHCTRDAERRARAARERRLPPEVKPAQIQPHPECRFDDVPDPRRMPGAIAFAQMGRGE